MGIRCVQGKGTFWLESDILRKASMVDSSNRVSPRAFAKVAENLSNLCFFTPHLGREQHHSTVASRGRYSDDPWLEPVDAYGLKGYLCDLAFRYLNPRSYQWVQDYIEKHTVERQAVLCEAISTLAIELPRVGIRPRLASRKKGALSTYQKALRKGIALDEIYDLVGVRAIVHRESECYQTLDLVHTLWHPVPGEFDDYIALPKPNGYRSLHTAVMSTAGFAFEVQIRTLEMHQEAEWGRAAHWLYAIERTGIRASTILRRQNA